MFTYKVKDNPPWDKKGFPDGRQDYPCRHLSCPCRSDLSVQRPGEEEKTVKDTPGDEIPGEDQGYPLLSDTDISMPIPTHPNNTISMKLVRISEVLTVLSDDMIRERIQDRDMPEEILSVFTVKNLCI